MEINKIITAAAFAALAMTASAQVQILGNGHVIVGDKNAVQPSQAMRIAGGYTTKDPVVPDTTFAMTVTSNGLNNTGGYIAFGSNGGAAIGETRLDNDVLNLIGKGGTDLYREQCGEGIQLPHFRHHRPQLHILLQCDGHPFHQQF